MTVLLVIHLLIVIALIGVILIQRSSADGFTGGGGSANPFMTSRGSANFLTRTTAILATAFIVSSLVLAYWASHRSQQTIVDEIQAGETAVPVEADAAPAKDLSVPIAE